MCNSKIVAVSAVKVELGALFLNAKEASVICLILLEIEHSQQPPPMYINNATAVEIVNTRIKRLRVGSMKTRYS